MSVAYAGRRRGEPLVVLVLLVGGWIALRCAMLSVPAAAMLQRAPPLARGAGAAAQPPAGDWQPSRALSAPRPIVPPAIPAPPAPLAPSASAPVAPPARFLPSRPASSGARIAAGHELLLMAGLGYLAPPESVRPALVGATDGRQALVKPSAGPPRLARWSGDSWLLLRRGSGVAGLAAGAPGYGGSQAGAVLRYRLAPASPFRPTGYARVASALALPGGESEAAAGLALRPVPAFPVSLLGEARVVRSAGVTRVRPAAMLITELPPQRLPFGADAEIYAQAGYAGGRGGSAFFDLQGVVDRSVAHPVRDVELRFGAGAWAGGQRGAVRLDFGPRALLRLQLAGGSSRLALDWRFRVAGQASPGSGPALTLSAGF